MRKKEFSHLLIGGSAHTASGQLPFHVCTQARCSSLLMVPSKSYLRMSELGTRLDCKIPSISIPAGFQVLPPPSLLFLCVYVCVWGIYVYVCMCEYVL